MHAEACLSVRTNEPFCLNRFANLPRPFGSMDVSGSRSQVPGSQFPAPGSRFPALSSPSQVPGSQFPVPGS